MRLDRRGLERTAEGAPCDGLPGFATAHLARPQLAPDRHGMPAIHAAELALSVIAGGQEKRPLVTTGSFSDARLPMRQQIVARAAR